jgi:hypothetical protein
MGPDANQYVRIWYVLLYRFSQPFAAGGRNIPLRKATVFGAGRATRPGLLFSDSDTLCC